MKERVESILGGFLEIIQRLGNMAEKSDSSEK